MPTFVLVHGAWHGAWSWDRVAPLLPGPATAPTLAGLGERSDAASADVDLDTHVADVVEHLGAQRDVTLVAHSYAGVVVAGVLAQAAERVGRLVLLDGFLPRAGEAMADHVGERGPAYRAEAERDPGWLIPPPPVAALGVVDPADIAWVEARLTPQPVQTYLQPVASADFAAVADRTYVACTAPGLAVLEESRRRAEAGGWRVLTLAAGHDALVTHPREVADAIAAPG